MLPSHNITMLGTGLIGLFYTMTLHGQRSRDRVRRVYSRSEDRAKAFAEKWDIPRWSTDMAEAVNDPETDVAFTLVSRVPSGSEEFSFKFAVPFFFPPFGGIKGGLADTSLSS